MKNHKISIISTVCEPFVSKAKMEEWAGKYNNEIILKECFCIAYTVISPLINPFVSQYIREFPVDLLFETLK